MYTASTRIFSLVECAVAGGPSARSAAHAHKRSRECDKSLRSILHIHTRVCTRKLTVNLLNLCMAGMMRIHAAESTVDGTARCRLRMCSQNEGYAAVEGGRACVV